MFDAGLDAKETRAIDILERMELDDAVLKAIGCDAARLNN